MQHGILINGSTFWVVHRSRVHGPFDYEWSTDLHGVEFLYQGSKFGEYCSADELYADLSLSSNCHKRSTKLPVS